MEEKTITLEVNGQKAVCTAHMGPGKYLHAFKDITTDFELYEDRLLQIMEDWKFERVYFTIPKDYDLSFTTRKFWRAYDEFIEVNGEDKVLVFYSADGKKFLTDLSLKEMDNDTKERLDKKFPGVVKHMKEPEVNERVVLSTIYNYVTGDFHKCSFDIDNKEINLTKITQFVKDRMGRKFASAHIMALRELRRKLDETTKQN